MAGVVIGRQGSGLEPALGLEISEVFHGAAQGGLGLEAGAIDIDLDARVFVVEHGIEFAFEADFVFDHDAAFETPCGADDFSGQHVFDGAYGAKFVEEAGGHGFIAFDVFGPDAVFGGEKAEIQGWFGVIDVRGFGLRGSLHFRAPFFGNIFRNWSVALARWAEVSSC